MSAAAVSIDFLPEVDVKLTADRLDPVEPMAETFNDRAHEFAPERLLNDHRDSCAVTRARCRSSEAASCRIRSELRLDLSSKSSDLPQKVFSVRERSNHLSYGAGSVGFSASSDDPLKGLRLPGELAFD
jgi:hypothetical protein